MLIMFLKKGLIFQEKRSEKYFAVQTVNWVDKTFIGLMEIKLNKALSGNFSRRTWLCKSVLFLGILCFQQSTYAQTSNSFSLTRSVVSSASGASVSANYIIVESVIGQSSAIGESQSNSYLSSGGYIRRIGDSDGDGVPDNIDNCSAVANADQLDTDDDMQGDACDNDDDGDMVDDSADNCPLIDNPDQSNSDDDSLGDACDEDDDGDGVDDIDDNCQFESNLDQTDTDGDLFGDICDTDDDDDGLLDEDDNCPLVANPGQEDDNGNGIGNECELQEDELCFPIRARNGNLALICL